MADPVELSRRLLTGDTQRAGNRVQLEDTAGQAVDAANPLDVSVAAMPGLADPLPVTMETEAGIATGTAANPLRTDPTGATAQPVTDGGGSLTVDGPLTDVQLRALAVPVSGPLTDAQLRALAVPISATQLPATLGAGGGLKVDGSGTPLPVSGAVAASGTVTANQGTAGAAAWPFYLTDSGGVANRVIDNKIRTSAMPYLYDVAEGNVTNHVPWTKIGYVPIGATTETDVWSYGGTVQTIPLIATAATLKVQTNNAADAGTSIFSGTSSGGSATSLVDATKDFTAGGAPVAIGDCVIMEKGGASPEWGFVTAIPNATTLTIAGGFSRGGSGSGRTYDVVDYSNQAGAHAVQITGLNSSWAYQREIVLCGGAGPGYVTTAKTWLRINSFRMIAAGANSKPTAAIALMDSAVGPTITYSYISAGYTRARNSHYTVPAGKALYIVEWNVGYVGSAAAKYCRIYTRASQYQFEAGDPSFLTRVSTGVNIWYPYTEILQSGGSVPVQIPAPTQFLPTVDLKVSAYSDAAGVVTSTLRGWLEDV